MGKMISLITGKVWGNTNHSQILGYLKVLYLIRTPVIHIMSFFIYFGMSVCRYFYISTSILVWDNTHMTFMKIVHFSRPLTYLAHLRPIFFHPLDLDVQFQTNSPFPNYSQSIKKKYIQG